MHSLKLRFNYNYPIYSATTGSIEILRFNYNYPI